MNINYLILVTGLMILMLAGIVSADTSIDITTTSGTVYAKYENGTIISSGTAGIDDTSVIQTGFDAIILDGIINFDDNSYIILHSITSINKNIVMQGNDTTFNINTGDGSAGFSFIGSKIKSANLLSDAKKGDDVITFKYTSSIDEGDLIRIYNDKLWCPNDYPTHKTGETYIVESVSGNSVTLASALIRDYTTVLNSKARIYNSVTVEIDGCKFIGIGSEEYVRGVSLNACTNSKISNCYFDDNGLCSIYLHTCHSVNINDNEIYNSNRNGLGYGVAVMNACSNVTIYNNIIENCRHCITSGDSSDYGVNRDVYILNNIVKGSGKSNVIDAHPSTINYLVANNTIYPKGNSAFNDGTINSIFRDNCVYNGHAIHKRGQITNSTKIVSNNNISDGSIIYQSNDIHIKELIITNNYVNPDPNNYGIYLNGADVEELIFTGNIIRGMKYGIRAYVDESKPSNINISNNTFENIYNNGIELIYEGMSHDECVLTVYDNTIHNANRKNSNTRRGINLVNTQNATVYNNKISDDDMYTRYGIYENAYCDYNTYYCNEFTGMKIDDYYIQGENSVILMPTPTPTPTETPIETPIPTPTQTSTETPTPTPTPTETPTQIAQHIIVGVAFPPYGNGYDIKCTNERTNEHMTFVIVSDNSQYQIYTFDFANYISGWNLDDNIIISFSR